MMRFFLLLVFGFLCILIQSNLFLYHYVFPIKPDLTIPLTAYAAIFLPPAQGLILVIIIGYLMDITSGGVLGFYLFLRLTIYLLVYFFKGQLAFENKLFFLTALVVFFLFEAFLTGLLFHFMGITVGTTQIVLTTALYQGIFTIVVWLMLYPLLTKLERLAERFRGF